MLEPLTLTYQSKAQPSPTTRTARKGLLYKSNTVVFSTPFYAFTTWDITTPSAPLFLSAYGSFGPSKECWDIAIVEDFSGWDWLHLPTRYYGYELWRRNALNDWTRAWYCDVGPRSVGGVVAREFADGHMYSFLFGFGGCNASLRIFRPTAGGPGLVRTLDPWNPMATLYLDVMGGALKDDYGDGKVYLFCTGGFPEGATTDALFVYDVTDPTAVPTLLDTGQSSLVAYNGYNQISILGNFLYRNCSSQIECWDISDPTSVVNLGSAAGHSGTIIGPLSIDQETEALVANTNVSLDQEYCLYKANGPGGMARFQEEAYVSNATFGDSKATLAHGGYAYVYHTDSVLGGQSVFAHKINGARCNFTGVPTTGPSQLDVQFTGYIE
jgi:hypothetical protein